MFCWDSGEQLVVLGDVAHAALPKGVAHAAATVDDEYPAKLTHILLCLKRSAVRYGCPQVPAKAGDVDLGAQTRVRQLIGTIRSPAWIPQQGKRELHLGRKRARAGGRALPDRHNAQSGRLEALPIVSQLNELRAAVGSAEVPNEYQHGRLGHPVARQATLGAVCVLQRDVGRGRTDTDARLCLTLIHLLLASRTRHAHTRGT